MATYTAGSGGDYATLQTLFASGVLANGDTAQLQPGYAVVEACQISGVDNLTLRGDPSNPSAAVISYNNPASANYVFALRADNVSGWLVEGVTLSYTGASSVYGAAFFGGWSKSVVTFQDCEIHTSGRYAVSYTHLTLPTKA